MSRGGTRALDLAVAVLLLVAPGRPTADVASGEPTQPLPAGTAFDRMRTLVGTWRGTDEDGRPVTIEYAVGVRGTTLIETQDPGTGDEMISVYSRDGAELVMTHYCPMGPLGNQPHMVLNRARSTPGTLVFDFTGGQNLDVGKDAHVHGGRITWLDRDRLRREWDVYKGGRPAGTTVLVLSRKR